MDKMFYSIEEVANMLGKTQADVNQMRMSGQIFAMRDGGEWKFKAEEVQRVMNPPKESSYYDEDEDALIPPDDSSVAGQGDGTVIGKNKNGASGSSSSLGLAMEADNEPGASSLDINATLDSDGASDIASDSVLDLGEDDLVLGESDALSDLHSDVTLNDESSGINLYKPEGYSGLSLDDNSMEDASLGSGSLNVNLDELVLDDEGLSIIEDGSGLATDGGDFTLTPNQEDTEDESESGSQVIALTESDSEDLGDPLMGEGPEALSDGFGIPSDQGFGNPQDPNSNVPVYATKEMLAAMSEEGLQEKPYSIWVILSLIVCLIMLTLTLMMTVDLVRSMWSWNKPFELNSQLMESILNMFN